MKLKLVPPTLDEKIDSEEREGDDTVGAAVLEDQSQLARQIATRALTAALAACKAGTCTPEQRAMVEQMARDAIQQTGKSFEELKGDQRTISVILPPPAPPIPIEVKVSDLAEAAKIANVAVSAASASAGAVSTTAKVLGWIGEHPNLTLGLVVGGVALWLGAPILAPIVLAAARK